MELIHNLLYIEESLKNFNNFNGHNDSSPESRNPLRKIRYSSDIMDHVFLCL